MRIPSHARSVLTRFLINRLFEFHHIHHFGAVEDKDEPGVTFGVKRSKVKVTARPNAISRRRNTDRRFAVKDQVVRG